MIVVLLVLAGRLRASKDPTVARLLIEIGRDYGIEPSDDPMISIRDGAYAESFSRRNP